MAFGKDLRHSSKKYMRLSHVLNTNRREQALLLLYHVPLLFPIRALVSLNPSSYTPFCFLPLNSC
jgi:hypothetical protein